MHLLEAMYSVFRCRGEYDHFTAYVELDGRMSEIRTFCGSETPHQVMSSQNILTAEFITHSHPGAHKTNAGFQFQYKFVDDFGIKGGRKDPRYGQWEGFCVWNERRVTWKLITHGLLLQHHQ